VEWKRDDDSGGKGVGSLGEAGEKRAGSSAWENEKMMRKR